MLYFYSIYDVAISPDGSTVVATAGNMLLVSDHHYLQNGCGENIIKPISYIGLLWTYKVDICGLVAE